jgi:hypothetical protein
MMDLTWDEFRGLLITKPCTFRWIERGEFYYLFISQNSVIYDCRLDKDGGANQLEFEADWKIKGNKVVYDYVATGGWACFLEGNMPEFPISLSTDINNPTVIIDINYMGKIEEYAMQFSNTDVMFILEIDGESMYEYMISAWELYDLNNSNNKLVDSGLNKQFSERFTELPVFNDSLRVLAYSLSSTDYIRGYVKLRKNIMQI